MAAQDRTALYALIDSLLADNTSGAITPEDVRDVLDAVVESGFNLVDDEADPAALIAAAAAKTDPVDADLFGIVDSEDGNALKQLSVANLKAAIFAAVGDLTAADALDGTELVHVVQGGNSRKVATSDLAVLPSGAQTVAGVKTFSDIPVLSGGGIKFPATQVPSADANVLDDYEEGDWTPVLTFATPGNLSVAYSVQTGSYEKIGRQVTVVFACVTTTFTHTTASSQFHVTGLPFNSAASAGLGHFGAFNHSQIASALALTLRLDQNDNKLFIGGSQQNADNTVLDVSHFPSGRNYTIRGTITYRAA